MSWERRAGKMSREGGARRSREVGSGDQGAGSKGMLANIFALVAMLS
jgi:hypothetical protein